MEKHHSQQNAMWQLLIADDDRVSRTLLVHRLSQIGYPVTECEEGEKAFDLLQNPDGPSMAILDWMMPGLAGTEICKKLRAMDLSHPLYLILLTSKTKQSDMVNGLDSGADDFLVKPVSYPELHARLNVGKRVLTLQKRLSTRVRELEEALVQIKQLQGLLPICSYCKSIRDDHQYWQRVEDYLSQHADVQLTHGICPHCYEKEVIPQIQALKLSQIPHSKRYH